VAKKFPAVKDITSKAKNPRSSAEIVEKKDLATDKSYWD
jgi:hypothetical protein